MAEPPAPEDLLASGAFLLSDARLERLPERFCPHCGAFYHTPEQRFCLRDGIALDEIDHGGDTGAHSITGTTVADKFILKRQLGAGGMGAVYLAVQKPMGREVAVKVIFRHLTSEPKMIERALREAEAANQVDHPNVVTIYDSGRTPDGLVYIAMEYLRGEDLGRLLEREGPMAPERALRLWLPAVRAIATAHRKGVVHRDLKPDNIFVATRRNEEGEQPRDEDVVKIVDFGIAKLRKSDVQGTMAGGLVGTLRYMSPEQLQGLETGPPADVYALGLILVQMLTGLLPWPQSMSTTEPPTPQLAFEATLATPATAHDGTPTATSAPASSGEESILGAFLRLSQPPTPLRELRPGAEFSLELQALVDSALATDPAARPADAAELLRQVLRLPELRRDAAGGPAEETEGDAPLPATCPFPGLESFDETQARFFCGRDEEIRQALQRLSAPATDAAEGDQAPRRWLQIEGASGAGKSSLARAGLIPAVLHGQVGGAPPFHGACALRPGRDPVRSLAEALGPALGLPTADCEARLRAGEDGLARLLEERLPAGRALLVVVDQLEEALLQAAAEPLAAFDALLDRALDELRPAGSASRPRDERPAGSAASRSRDERPAASAASRPLYLVTTIRSDLLARFQALPRLEARLNEAARYYLRPMSEEGLRQAILEPARLAGLFWDKGLPEQLVADAREAEGGGADRRDGAGVEVRGRKEASLPLLGHVLRALWEQRSGRRLTRQAYDALGGVSGALSRSADGLLDGLSPAARERARRLFLRLVKIGRGTPDTRQLAPRGEALALLRPPTDDDDGDGDGDGGEAAAREAETLLLRLSGARDPGAPPDAPPPPRLLVITSQGSAEDAKVDLVHESLLQGWQTLREWIAKDRAMLERRDDLEQTAQLWESTGHPEGGLPQGGVLAYYQGAGLDERQRQGLELLSSPRARRFLDEARALEKRMERERRRRLQRTIALLSAILLLMAAAAAFALAQRQRARRQQARAERRLRDSVDGASRVLSVIDRDLRPIAGTTEVRRELLVAVGDLLEDLLADAQDDPALLRSRLLSRQQRGDLARTHEDTKQAQAEYEAALQLALQLTARHPRELTYKLDLIQCYRRLGDVAFAAGRVPETQAAFGKELELARALASAAPDRGAYQLELAEALQRMGDLLARTGNLPKAREDYRGGREILESLLRKEPKNSQYRHALAVAEERLGESLTRGGELDRAKAALQRSQELLQELLRAEPMNGDYNRTLGASYTRLGALYLDAGHLGAAEEAYQRARETYERLLQDDPESSAHRQALASTFRAMGDIAQRAGELARAREHYLGSLKLRTELAQADPGNLAYQQGISTLYASLGDLDGKAGQLARARAAYEQALALRKRIAEADPQNAYSRQRLAFAYQALGDVAEREGKRDEALAHYREALELRQGLLKADPKNARYRQELATAHSKIGALGKGPGPDHQQAIAMLQELVREYPQNAVYRQELATSYGRLGRSQLAAGQAQAAHESYDRALGLRQALVEGDAKNAEWQRDLLLSHLEIARLCTGSQRRSHVSAARGMLAQLEGAGLLEGDQEIEGAREAIAELRRRH